MKGAGGGLIAVGIMLMLGAMMYQPTVTTESSYVGGIYQPSQEVYNLGALQFQELLFNGGAALLIAGCVLFAIGELQSSLIRAGTAKEEISASALPPEPAATAPCDWCGRTLDIRFRTCTSFAPEQLEEASPRVRDEVCKVQLAQRGYSVGGSDTDAATEGSTSPTSANGRS